MFRRKRSADAGMTVNAEMPDNAYETDFVDAPPTGKPISRRERRAAEKAAKRQATRKKAAAKHKAAAKKKGARNGAKKPQPEKQNKRAISAQATIPYREMGKDGICRVHDQLYSHGSRMKRQEDFLEVDVVIGTASAASGNGELIEDLSQILCKQHQAVQNDR